MHQRRLFAGQTKTANTGNGNHTLANEENICFVIKSWKMVMFGLRNDHGIHLPDKSIRFHWRCQNFVSGANLLTLIWMNFDNLTSRYYVLKLVAREIFDIRAQYTWVMQHRIFLRRVNTIYLWILFRQYLHIDNVKDASSVSLWLSFKNECESTTCHGALLWMYCILDYHHPSLNKTYPCTLSEKSILLQILILKCLNVWFREDRMLNTTCIRERKQ